MSSTGTKITRKHTGKRDRRERGSALVDQTPRRTTYRGTTRNRSAKAAKGHPLAGLWQSLPGMRRSYRPAVRAYAFAQFVAARANAWDEMATVTA